MSCAWTQELDLQLVQIIQGHWGSDIWTASEHRTLSWETIFASALWPEGFTKDMLKERWQENFRKWVPRDTPKRATVVDFNVLRERILQRGASKRRAPRLQESNLVEPSCPSSDCDPRIFGVEPIEHISHPPAAEAAATSSSSDEFPLAQSFESLIAHPVDGQCEDLSLLLSKKRRAASPNFTESTPLSSTSSSPSSSMPVLPPPPQQLPNNNIVDELLARIDWSGRAATPKARRIRGPAAESQLKHTHTEAERRGAMNRAIDEIASLLPPSQSSAPPTKLATLVTAADYFRRVQDIACALIEENKRLASLANQHPSPQQPSPLPLHDGSPSSPLLTRHEVVQFLMVGFFVVWLCTDSLLPFVTQPTPHSPQSRQVLQTDSSVAHVSPVSLFLPFLGRMFVRIATSIVVFFVFYIAILLYEMPRVSVERVAEAKRHIDAVTQSALEGLHNWNDLQLQHRAAMAALNKQMPRCLAGDALFLGVQLTRALMQHLEIGLWLERVLVRLTHRKTATVMEAQAYVLACMLPDVAQAKRPIRLYAALLASISNSAIDPTASSLLPRAPLLAHLTSVHAGLMGRVLHRAYNKLRVQAAGEEFSHWPVVVKTLLAGDIDAALKAVASVLPLVEGESRLKLLHTAATVFFCARRFEEAFLVHSTATTLPAPAFPRRFMVLATVLELVHLQRLDDARRLLRQIEEMVAGLPADNLMPPEMLLLHTAKIATLPSQTDFAAIVSYAQVALKAVRALRLLPMFPVPFVLEMIVERLLPALESTSASEFYVIGHRDVIAATIDELLLSMEMVHWPRLASSTLKRCLGWRAHVRGDLEEATRLLHESVHAAHEAALDEQAARTLELIERLRVRLPQEDKPERPQLVDV